jgi:calcium/calmodulin-dependent serine protein kinase
MLTILPSFNPAMSDVKQLFVRAFFDYDPATDDMCPSKEFGLPFKFGEILQVISLP